MKIMLQAVSCFIPKTFVTIEAYILTSLISNYTRNWKQTIFMDDLTLEIF